MKPAILIACLATVAVARPGAADPAAECGLTASSQVEIGNCVAAAETVVDQTIEMALGFAMESAGELDTATGRPSAVPALEAAQAAWSAYRDAQCEYAGSLFGGGSGTGIAISACRVDLGRARADALMSMAN